MKFAIYFLALNLTLGIIFAVTTNSKFSSKSNAKALAQSQAKTISKAKFELTFSSSNSIPESTKLMENVFSKKQIKVQSKLTIIGEPVTNENENKILFTEGEHSLRFKQNNKEAEFKNLEVPEIRKTSRNVDSMQYTEKLVDSDSFMKLENELLLRFKETLSRNLRNEELVSVSNVKVLNK